MEFIYRSLRNPQEAIVVRAFGMLLVVVGLVVGTYWGYVCIQRLAPFNRPAYTSSIRGWGDPFYGGSYIAIVAGREIECTGGDQPFSTEDQVAVVYDLDSPNRCRRADKIGRLSVWEGVALMQYSWFVLVGTFLLTVRERERSCARKFFNRACLGLGLVFIVVGMYYVAIVTGV